MNNNKNRLKVITTAVLLCCSVATFHTATANCETSAEAINKQIGALDTTNTTKCQYLPVNKTLYFQCGSCRMNKLFHINTDTVKRVPNVTNGCSATNANGIKFKFLNTGELSTLSC
jgi:hypothetical protein